MDNFNSSQDFLLTLPQNVTQFRHSKNLRNFFWMSCKKGKIAVSRCVIVLFTTRVSGKYTRHRVWIPCHQRDLKKHTRFGNIQQSRRLKLFNGICLRINAPDASLTSTSLFYTENVEGDNFRSGISISTIRSLSRIKTIDITAFIERLYALMTKYSAYRRIGLIWSTGWLMKTSYCSNINWTKYEKSPLWFICWQHYFSF